ncbi:MAG: hypothetical protein FWH34_07025 [Desulfovibrionaceae bacterium]|nr:hypothetical protein [Desulfovibrionaceae bacterium]
MKLPNPRAPAQSKPPPKTAQPEPLSASEAKKLGKAGERDGHHGVPKQDENGAWTSPLVQKEANAYDAFCIFAWGELQEKQEGAYKEISRLCQEIHIVEERLTAQRKEAPPPPDLTERFNGEEKHSAKLIRTRRQREYELENAAYFSKLKQTEASLDNACRRLSELQSTVQSAEKTTSMQCECAASRATERITVYWQGALKTHPLYDRIPPIPEITLESNAESDYQGRNRAVREEAALILSRKPTTSGGAAANTRRTEDNHHAPKKKPTRK